MSRQTLLFVVLAITVGVSVGHETVCVGQVRTFSASEQRIRFARGAHGATLRGSVREDRAILYTLNASAGQSMTVALDCDCVKTRFDLSGPKDKSGQALASGVQEWTGTLADDGDYKIFVFTDAREVNMPFTLRVTVVQ